MTNVNALKSSLAKNIRNSIVASYPFIEPYMEQIIHKKDPLRMVKW